MKRSILLLLSSFFVLTSYARILTVDNAVGKVAMYKSVQTAYDNCVVGDTIFLHASTTAYSNITINKKIVLLGEGGLPDYNSLSASISTITIDSLAGVKIAGFQMNGIACYNLNIGSQVKGALIKNCYIAGNASLNGTSHIFIDNVVGSAISNLGASTIVSNCVIFYYANTGTNCVIKNNIFIRGDYNYSLVNLTNCSIVNNIFIHNKPAIGSGNLNNSYSKNIQAGTDLPVGNFSNVQPINVFVETSVTQSMSMATALGSTWQQLATSVGKNAGTDGKDVGVYGGGFAWSTKKIFNGDPGLPKIQSIEVQNAVLEPNAVLKINFKAKSSTAK